MNAVLRSALAGSTSASRHPLAHVWHAWRSSRSRELGWFLWIGGLNGGMSALALADGSVGGRSPALLATETLMPLLGSMLLMLAWLPADRSDPASPHRVRHLAAAVLLASAVSALLLPVLTQALELPTVMDLIYREKNMPPPGWLALHVVDFLAMLVPSGLAVAVIEMAGRHRRSEQAMCLALHEHAALARSALESQLAAMQAQVEPQFLFDVLVDIERLYGAAPGSGGAADGAAVAQMDRLITYLRVALPRLRDSGSSVGAEVDLLSCYLDLVQALRGGRPSFRSQVPQALRSASFHPMLLLPLVQRAVRSAGPPPDHIDLQALQRDGRLLLVLSLAAPDLCRNDPELARLHERLRVLYDGQASLHCEELPADAGALSEVGRHTTRFTLSLPR